MIGGRLIESPTSDATGIIRRAFGEFVGPGGELASYAFGWTTCAGPHEARMSVGIGAGDPDGGTFHAVVFTKNDNHAYALVDSPFEQVPQGGPDLTADLSVGHDRDGMLQLIGTTDANGQNGRINHLHHAVDTDSSLMDVLGLQPGHRATRSRIDGPWTRHMSDSN